MHGFAIGTELYVGFCWTDEEKVACAPYISFTTAGDDIRVDHETGGHYMALFNSAFSQLWKNGRPIWPE
jgi:hypothetical protein